jgi:hypothetical protein
MSTLTTASTGPTPARQSLGWFSVVRPVAEWIFVT